MAQDYSEYLAVNVLNEQQYVNYRNLSRALKVHSNLAKQMLYEFHRKQNGKKPGSVHATYLISGAKRPASSATITQSQENDGEDSTMRSSPPLPSSSFKRPDDQEEVKPIHTVVMVREEHLEEAKAQFESISGIHIYSLQVGGVSDVQVLTDCNRRLAVEYAKEDPLTEWKQYGVVQNPDVRRRTTKGQPPPPPPPAAKKPAAAAAPAAKPAVEEKQAEAKPAANNASQQKSTTSATSKTAGSKNQNSSLFKSFAKGSAAAKKKAESQESSAAPSPAAAEPEDVPMTGFSDDDEDDADTGLPAELEEVKAPTGESKNERKSKLEAMMDEEDEEMEDAATPASAEESPHDEGAIDVAEPKEEPKESVVVENGRRRGRRRVMKKKTVKDEDGYLVTREEAAWESFSEDEPVPKKAKTSSTTSSKPTAKKAAGGGGGKPGQGNIMSFFSKK